MLTLSINAQVLVDMEFNSKNCDDRDPIYLAKIYVKYDSPKPAEYLGNHSIYVTYDPSVLKFMQYKPINFHDKSKCITSYGMPYFPYDKPVYNGNTPGHFIVTNQLKSFNLGLCFPINKWTLVGEVAFYVNDYKKDPKIDFYGTDSGYPENSRGVNFADETNHEKHKQVFVNTSSPSFISLCQLSKKTDNDNSFLTESTDFEIAPNPVKDFLNIVSNQSEDCSIQIFSISGKLVHQEQLLGSESKTLNLTDWVAGNYFIKISNANKSYTEKFILLE